MKRFFKWHKELTESMMKECGISWYSISWMAFIKGLVFGFAIYYLIKL